MTKSPFLEKKREERLAVVVRHEIGAGADRVWEFLTVPALISEWFADCRSFAPKSAFRLDFGDGDYFAGRVIEWDAPRRLRLAWRFMDIGVESDILYQIEASPSKSAVIVHDCGASCSEAAEGLREGWEDFLSRLERRMETGKSSRYRWSQSIGLGARTALTKKLLLEMLAEGDSWINAFPVETRLVVPAPGLGVDIEFHGPSFGGGATKAQVRIQEFDDCTHVNVTHSGWDQLPLRLEQQIEMRREYAGIWQAILERFETMYPVECGIALPASRPEWASGQSGRRHVL